MNKTIQCIQEETGKKNETMNSRTCGSEAQPQPILILAAFHDPAAYVQLTKDSSEPTIQESSLVSLSSHPQ